MIKVRDFKCDNGHTFEVFVSDGTTVTRCDCGASAKPIVSATKCMLDPVSGHFPGAASKWIREHEKAGAKGKREGAEAQ